MVGVQAFLGTAALKWNGSLRENYTVKPAPGLMCKPFVKNKTERAAGPCPVGSPAPSPRYWAHTGNDS